VSLTPSRVSFSLCRKSKNAGLKIFCERLVTGDGRE
jgi:hypothetical protein